MKPKISPTSPKYAVEHPIARLYQNSPLQQPLRGPRWGNIVLIAALISLVGGVAGFLGLTSLYRHYPNWSVWNTVGLPLLNETDEGVIVREPTSVDRTDAGRQDMLDRVSSQLVSIYLAPSGGADSELVDRLLSPDRYRGTGVLVTEDGIIALDASIMNQSDAEYVAVTDDGLVRSLTLVATDPFSDFGFGRIDGSKYPVASFAVEADLRLGQTVYELTANALRGRPELDGLVIEGRAVQPDTLASQGQSSELLTRFLKVSSENADKNNGAPLIDTNGSVVGLRLNGLDPGLVFPVQYVRIALESFLLHGEIERSKLGVTSLDISTTPGLAAADTGGRTNGALLVASDSQPAVLPGGPADNAGLESGDVIIALGDRTISAGSDLNEIVQSIEVGRTIAVRYVRKGAEQTANVTLGKFQ